LTVIRLAGSARPDGGQRGAHPLAAFRHRLVAEPDDGEADKARGDMDLHVDGHRLDALEGHGGHMRCHGRTPLLAANG
jgi:hypothetical protein